MTSYVRDVCPYCGNLRVVCGDPERAVYPQRTTCYITAVRDLTMRQVQKKYGHPDDKNVAELHPTDGMHVWASTEDLTPGDDFV